MGKWEPEERSVQGVSGFLSWGSWSGVHPGSHQIQSVKMCRVHPATVPLEPVYSRRCHITQVWDSRGFWSPAYPYPMLNPLQFGGM